MENPVLCLTSTMLHVRMHLTFSVNFMHQIATFKEIFSLSYAMSKKLFWAYTRAMLLLIGLIILFRAIAFAGMVTADLSYLMSRPVFKGVLWAIIILSFTLEVICQIVASITPVVIAVEKTPFALRAIKRSCTFMVRSILLSLWICLRSFVWVSIIGVVLIFLQPAQQGMALLGWLLVAGGIVAAIALMPRFWFALILLLRDNKPVLVCASESFRKTGGYWGKIFGNLLLLTAVFFGVSAAVFIVGAALAGIVFFVYSSNQASGIALGVPLMIAFACVFLGLCFFMGILRALFDVNLLTAIEKSQHR